MNLLKEGIEHGDVRPTDLKVRHTIDDVTREFAVYSIKTNLLYYNDQNDRIATWISQYEAENERPISSLPRDKYNEVIEKFIVDSNTLAINGTEKSIAKAGQRVPGVVLNDGRVVDGNRRLTCIRRIAKKNTSVGWFDAVILDEATSSDPKRIKMLELSIQHGEESKVDYDPIDRLVGVYNDIIKNQLLTPAEYAKSCAISEADVNKLIEQATYMEEFLDFANAREQYHLARDLEIAGPIGEMHALLNKEKSQRGKKTLKNIVYANILIQPEGDITRYVRKFKKIVGTPAEAAFTADEQNAMVSLISAMGVDPMTKEKVRFLRSNKNLVDEFQRAAEKADASAKRNKMISSPLDKSADALSDLNQILPEMLSQLNPSDRQLVKNNLKQIISIANARIEEINSFD